MKEQSKKTTTKNDRPKISKEERKSRLKRQEGNIEKDRQKGIKYVGYVRSVLSGDAVKLINVKDLEGRGKSKEPLHFIPEVLLRLHGVRAPSMNPRPERKREEKKEEKEEKKEEEKDSEDEEEEVVDVNKEEEGEGEGEGEFENVRKLPPEPFAWDSRDYLRRRVVGKTVMYRIESKSTNSKTLFGELFLYENGEVVNISHEMIKLGLLSASRSDYFERLLSEKKDLPDTALGVSLYAYKKLKDLEKAAAESGVGIHTSSQTKKEASIRTILRSENISNSFELFDKIKNIPLHGIVEQVRNGSTFRVLILDRMEEITVLLAGVKCPEYFGYGQNPKYAYEAKNFSEIHLLQRDVEVYIEKIDDNNKFYGTIKVHDNEEFDIGIELLQNGLAYFVEWSVSNRVDSNELRNAQEQARNKALKIWKNNNINNNETDSNINVSKKNAGDVTGRVVEIISGGSFRVSPIGDREKKNTKLIKLSSIKIGRIIGEREEFRPQYPPSDLNEQDYNRWVGEEEKRWKEEKENTPYSLEAKEYLRKKLIGQNIACLFDYRHNNENYYSVYNGDSNIAEELLELGFGKVTNHKSEEPRSRDYQKLVYALNKAQKSGKGIHSKIKAKQTTRTELFSEKDYERAIPLLSSLKRAGKVQGVVEQVLSATRFKVFIKSDNVLIIVTLAGLFSESPVRIETNDRKGPRSFNDIYPPTIDENHGLHYARDLLFQRDVELSITEVNKYSKFKGKIFYKGEDIALDIIRQGFAEVVNPPNEDFNTYINQQNIAKSAVKGLWQRFNFEKEREEEEKFKRKKEENRNQPDKRIDCIITEIIDGSQFYYQEISEKTALLEKMMADIHATNLDNESPYGKDVEIPKRELVFAKFNDGKYYRAQVQNSLGGGKYRVFFIDYGNTDVITSNEIRKFNNQEKFGIKTLKPQAQLGNLAYIKTPKIDQEYGPEAAEFFKDLVVDQQLIGICWKDKGKMMMKLGVKEKKKFVNIEMVIHGFARIATQKVDKRKSDETYIAIKEEEEIARKSGKGIWEYGIVPDSDEEREEELEKKKAKNKEKKEKAKQEKQQ